MAEYIDRDAAFNTILHLVPKIDDDGYCWVIRGDAAIAIDSIPAADVRPVKRGKWVKNIRGDYCLVCSECGYGFPTDGFAWLDCNRRSDERETACHINDIMDFCPNCGADMREES